MPGPARQSEELLEKTTCCACGPQVLIRSTALSASARRVGSQFSLPADVASPDRSCRCSDACAGSCSRSSAATSSRLRRTGAAQVNSLTAHAATRAAVARCYDRQSCQAFVANRGRPGRLAKWVRHPPRRPCRGRGGAGERAGSAHPTTLAAGGTVLESHRTPFDRLAAVVSRRLLPEDPGAWSEDDCDRQVRGSVTRFFHDLLLDRGRAI